MNRMMITGTNTLTQLQKQLDTISHNMANVDTVGYKRRETSFTDLLFQHYNNQPITRAEINRHTPNGIRQGVGAKVAQSQLIATQGSLKRTDRQLDLALTKENQYFGVHVQDANNGETRLTRNGALYFSPISNDEVILVNNDGYLMLDEFGNPIQLRANPSEISISNDGHLQVAYSDGTNIRHNLMVYQVEKPQALVHLGENLMGLPDNAAEIGLNEADVLTLLNGQLRQQIGMQQGTLEHSNVDISKEMTELINTQRAYQFQSRTITLADQMMGLVTSIR